MPLVVSIGGTEHVLGSVQHWALSAAVASINANHVHLVPYLHNTIHQKSIPEVIVVARP